MRGIRGDIWSNFTQTRDTDEFEFNWRPAVFRFGEYAEFKKRQLD